MNQRWPLSICALALSVAACAEPDAEGAGARVAITVSPLSLAGIGDATYVLRVLNGGGAEVWSRQVTSSAYGDGAGSVSYVGPCDADPAVAQNRVQLELVSLTTTGGATLVSGVDYINPAPASAPLERTVACLPDRDAPVPFDITFARAAEQGFFDVAVQFEDLFCSAKLDCRDALNQPLLLLHDADGARAATAVFAFACTGGAGADTHLYLSDLELDCGGGDVVSVDPSLGPGNLSAVPGSGIPNDHLFQALVTRGSEQLGTYTKRYWNVSLGLEDVAGCTLSATGTASDGAFAGGATPSGNVWPYVAWTAAMDSCTRHAVNGADGVVTTEYTGFGGLSFAHVYDGTDGIAPTGDGSFANAARWPDGVYPASCDGYRYPAPPHVYTGTPGTGFWTIDPLQDGNTVVVYCDMTSDGGGWTRVLGVINAAGQHNPLPQSATLHAGLAAAAVAGGHPRPTALRPWYLAGGFGSVRFECEKNGVGRKVDLYSSTPAVLDYFTGQPVPPFPTAPGTITTLPGDTSVLSGYTTATADGGPLDGQELGGPTRWGLVGTSYYSNTWGHQGVAADGRLSNHAMFIGFTVHWLYQNPTGVRTECDDYDGGGASHQGYWFIWVR